MKCMIPVLGMVLICGNSYAAFWDGNQLHQFCESDEAAKIAFCSGYISAVYDRRQMNWHLWWIVRGIMRNPAVVSSGLLIRF